MSVIVVLTHPMLTQLIESVGYRLPEHIRLRLINVSLDAIEKVALTQDKKQDVDVLLSAGGNAVACSRLNLQKRFVTIRVTGFDIMNALFRAGKFSDRVAVVTYREPLEGLARVRDIFAIHIEELIYNSLAELDALIAGLAGRGIRVVIGSSLVMEKAERHNLTGVFVYSPDGVIRAFDLAVSLINSAIEEQRRAEEFKTILDCTQSAIMAVDNAGIVKVFNPGAVKISGVPMERAVGRFVSDVIKGSRLPGVLESRESEYNQIQVINGTPVLTNRVPVIVDDVVIGAVATFQDFKSIQLAEDTIKKKHLEKGFVAKTTFDRIVGASPALEAVRRKAQLYAAQDFTVLITGETGTGKELFASAIHNASPRRNGPFVAVNCSAFPEALLESELFGYVEGAFTGALKTGRAGLFETAHTGTIFLDEIADFPLHLQARLLRTLEERTTMRIGSDRVTPVDIRVIAATNRNLQAMVEAGQFRRDLFYRLNVLYLKLPTLRERPGDIARIVEHVARQLGLGVERRQLRELEALVQGLDYAWPGNVRELRNVMERFMSLFHEGCAPCAVMREVLAEYLEAAGSTAEIRPLMDVIARAGGSKTRAARELGISRTTLWRRLRRAAKA